MAASLRILVIAVLLQAGATVQADQELLPAQSHIGFVSQQMGVPVEGQFKRFDAQVAFDPKKPEAARIAIGIDLSSVSLGTKEVEAELAQPEWFAAQRFPTARFRASLVKPTGPGRFEVTGTLALKGIERAIVVPVLLTQAQGRTTASGSFTLKRLDYRIGAGEWSDPSLVADEVRVNFKLVLAGVPAL